MPYKKVKLAEECAIQAFGIDRDYYFKFRSSHRVEIANIRQMTYRLAKEVGRCVWRTVIEYMELKSHATCIVGVKHSKALESYDKEYAKIYQRAKELYFANLAEMDNNH